MVMHQLENLFSSSATSGNVFDLHYFIALQESQPIDTLDHSAEKWNHRADAWEKERVHGRRGTNNDRINNTVAYLKSRGLLGAKDDIVDIGCGSGCFAVEFARTTRSVMGLDIAEKMIHYGEEHAKREGVHNVTFCIRDFQTLDVEREGLAGRFDLVFSSLTPAIHGMNGLNKVIQMSRAYCCYVTHVSSTNQLERQIMWDVFDREPPVRWDGRCFYSLLNILFLMGYYPEVTYDHRHRERHIVSDADYVELLMEHMLSPQECTPENQARINTWIQKHADGDGAITEISDTCYGRILWDVRQRSNPRNYRLLV